MDMFNLNDKLFKVFELIKAYGKNQGVDFDKVELIVTDHEQDCTRYHSVPDEETLDLIKAEIFVNANDFDLYNTFITDYYNERFNLELKHELNQCLVRMLCHECGHHANYDKYKYSEEEYYEQVDYIFSIYEEKDERQYAYRQIDEEYDADTFAGLFLKEHLGDCLQIMAQ